MHTKTLSFGAGEIDDLVTITILKVVYLETTYIDS